MQLGFRRSCHENPHDSSRGGRADAYEAVGVKLNNKRVLNVIMQQDARRTIVASRVSPGIFKYGARLVKSKEFLLIYVFVINALLFSLPPGGSVGGCVSWV